MATKYLDYTTLKRLNKSSIKAGRNRNLYFEKLPINPECFYPISMAFPHQESEMRLKIVFNEKGSTGFLDISLKEYQELPETETIEQVVGRINGENLKREVG